MLESYQLPDADDWTVALVEQWKWVRTTVDEPQACFMLSEAKAEAKLAELGRSLALECQKDQELFQVACLRLQEEQKRAGAEISEKLDRIQGENSDFREARNG